MLEESLPAIWPFIYSWFTHTVLFVLINAVVVTIAFSTKKEEITEKIQLIRTLSFLERLKSINLFRNKSQEINIPPITTLLENPIAELTVETVTENVETVTEDVDTVTEDVDTVTENVEHHLGRSASETINPMLGEMTVKIAQMKKSASYRSQSSGSFEKEAGVTRPATMREGKTSGDDEVDSKADDFINKFRQQLKLQRIASFGRYKDMLNRGK
ncbi:uncharacterized protein LOC143845652 [Tasmannia lanceolata]|uniref:uncharacterized protein LOC143845652 n=1 Tax=Tasmannia lanceolata TaxID=3420 RepID=UPI004064B255